MGEGGEQRGRLRFKWFNTELRESPNESHAGGFPSTLPLSNVTYVPIERYLLNHGPEFTRERPEFQRAILKMGAWESAGPLKLPLPRPVGSLRTTFCDDNVRIARGGRGGVFVTKRVA